MASNNITGASSLMRLTGLSGSGIDTDSIVKQLMTAERIPLNKLYQKKQLAEWKQDAYREITNKLRELKDTYFNSTKFSSNLQSPSSFIKYVGSSTNSSYVTVSGNADSVAGSHTVSVISVATAGKAVGTSGITDALTGNAISDDAFNLSGKTIKVTLDGVTREITLGDYSTSQAAKDAIGTQIQTLVDDAFGSNKIVVGYNADSKQLTFSTNTVNGAGRVTLSSGSKEDGLASLGFVPGASNRLDTNKSLEALSTSFMKDLQFTNGKLRFTINSKEFTFDKSVSLNTMMNTINADTDAKVNMAYDEMTDKFIITAKQTGVGQNIVIGADQDGNFFGTDSASGIMTGNATTNQGQDASAKIDGQLVTRSNNTFSVNGVTYTLMKAHASPAAEYETVSLTTDTEDVYKNIKGFVDKYNEIISFINTKLTEKYDRGYQPLTNEQKEGMKDEDIKTWESKAKTGLLRNDSMLQDIVYNMRRALSDNIQGVSTSLYSIGITTGDWRENGKLTIDETKLKAAIEKDPNSVAELFIKKSDISYNSATTADLRTKRYNSEGLANRISDVLEDNIRTTFGKGLLLQKAGIEGDATQYSSTLYEEIDDYNDAIVAMTARLNNKETAYYNKFTALEKYISQMSAQSSWLTSQFGRSS